MCEYGRSPNVIQFKSLLLRTVKLGFFYRRFGTAYWSRIHASRHLRRIVPWHFTLGMDYIRCIETSEKIHKMTASSTLEHWRRQPHFGESRRYRSVFFRFLVYYVAWYGSKVTFRGNISVWFQGSRSLISRRTSFSVRSELIILTFI
jgi:hypothetical protein